MVVNLGTSAAASSSASASAQSSSMTGEFVTETLQLGTALNSEFQQTAAAALSVTFGNTSQRS